jgi:hypothetical protein
MTYARYDCRCENGKPGSQPEHIAFGRQTGFRALEPQPG